MKHGLCNSIVVAIGALSVAFSVGACALMAKAQVVDVRYFSPERAMSRPSGKKPWGMPPTTSRSAPLAVRLGRVFSGRNLRERIAYRDTAYEVGYYDNFRWTERPEVYVRRQLGRSLFEVHGLSRAISGEAPTLDVEVLAFDDLRLQTERAAQVQVSIILYDDAGVFLENTLTVDRQAARRQPEIEGVVAAMATALDAAVEEVSRRVHLALAARQPQ